MMETMQERRFDALNAWRGIGAAAVAVYHFNYVIHSHISDMAPLAGVYVMLDFFFVLSGFVIASNYEKRMAEGYAVKDFMVRRFMRIYPLHFFTLILLVGLEMTKFVIPVGGGPFASDYKSIDSLFANIFLLQGMGIYGITTWNAPSWSISVEFFTYILFAVSVLWLRHRLWMLCLASVIIVPAALYFAGIQTMDLTTHGAIFRSIYGFSAGVLCYHLYLWCAQYSNWKKFLPVLEILAVVAVAGFIVFLGLTKFSLLSPLFLMPVTIIFAFEGGPVSRFLKQKIFMVLALLSYSAYLMHYVLHQIFFGIFKTYEKLSGQTIIHHTTNALGMTDETINLGLWFGDLMQVLMLAIVFGVSYFTCRYIELPFNEWGRRYVRRKSAANSIVEPATAV
ncbi:MAG: hypothetical protein DI551_10155 [Micavibrio aeruginosavorus]|uniref:Acyltransferase 3 domain-containing protein n=1 Tax=Micavibrio aeruginosavorus TaxID=349221 RepID=A0A2W5PPJ5_9BACT|nr:MAG: hypothetical protein DI551_10155 [Micavibrio aeruginosavorus]